jgi:hypothetical protein
MTGNELAQSKRGQIQGSRYLSIIEGTITFFNFCQPVFVKSRERDETDGGLTSLQFV